MRWRREVVAAAIAFVLAAAPVLVAGALLLRNERATQSEETQMLAEQAALRLADFVQARLLVLDIVRRESAQPSFVPDERFDSLAEATEAEYAGFQAINWVNARGRVRRVVPYGANQPAMGRDLTRHEATAATITRAFRERAPRATPPIRLLQGGRGFATYFPVVRDGALVGAVNGVFRVDDLVEGCLGERMLDRFEVVVEDEGDLVYGRAIDPALTSAAFAVPVLDRAWRLRLAARDGIAVVADPALLSFLAGGLALAVAVAVAAFFASHRQQLRLEHEREQRQLEQRVAHTQRLEALGRLAGGVAHDFNNLLAVILAAGELALIHRDELPPHVRESIEDALTAAERASALTRQLLAFAREQPRHAQTLEMRDVVHTTERLLRRLVREDVALEVRLPDHEVWIESDAAQLTQVIVNLVINASEALAGPGHISVALEVRDGRGPREPRGTWAVLDVSDDGPGIAPDVIEHLYEPFFTTRAERGGTGLGLATVHGILRQHGGHVLVESELGQGATFRVLFPLSRRAATDATRREDTGKRATGGRVVLVVEDEALVRRATTRALATAGYDVCEARDGVDALEQLDTGVCPDVVVSDVVMPRMGGLDLLRALRARGTRVAFILVSGHADVTVGEDELRALEARFVAKPFTAAELVSGVARALSASSSSRAGQPRAS